MNKTFFFIAAVKSYQIFDYFVHVIFIFVFYDFMYNRRTLRL